MRQSERNKILQKYYDACDPKVKKMFRDTFGDIFIEKEVKKNVADR